MNENRREGSASQNARPTIGFLAPDLLLPYHQSMWDGIAEFVQERGLRALCFAGGHLRFSSDGEPVDPRNLLYDLVTEERVDGLIVSAPVGNYISAERFQTFLKRYSHLPQVLSGRALPDTSHVLIDNETGMREALIHLVEGHGYRRLAFIRGPEDNEEAELRYRTYRDVLAEHNLPFDSDLVAPGDFLRPAGVEAIRLFTEERGIDLSAEVDVVVSASDMMAIGALDALRARDIRVPGDVALVGFDDVEEARTLTPSLTTVRQSPAEMGQRSAELLVGLLEGEEVPDEVVLHTRLVTRRSCGCPEPLVAEAAVGEFEPVDDSIEAHLAARREDVVATIRQKVGANAAERADELVESLITEFDGQSSGAFLDTLEKTLHHVAATGGQVEEWHSAISALRRFALPALGDGVFCKAQDLWSQAHVMIGEAARQTRARRDLEVEEKAETLRRAGQKLMTVSNVTDLVGRLADELPQLGVGHCYLSLYDRPEAPTERARMALSYDAERGGVIDSPSQVFPTARLVPGGLLSDAGAGSLVIEPLYAVERQIGFVLLGMESRREGISLYEPLREEISSALQSALITERAARRALQLQTAAEVSRTASSILDLERLLPRVVDLIRERFRLYYAGLFLVEGDEAVLQVGTGEAGREMVEEGHSLTVGGESMIGQCVARREARIALDVGEAAVRFDNPHLPKTRSELALPLVSRDEAIGALTIQSDREAAFSEEDITVLQTMADQVANAIANAQLYDALAQEQTLMRALMENVPEHVYFKDEESRFIRISRSQAERFGLDDSAEAVGKTDFDFFTEEHARPAYEDEQEIIETGEPLLNIEERETWSDRPDTWVLTSKLPLRDEDGDIIGTFGISSDITARKRAEMTLARRASQLQAAAEVAREATSIRDVRKLLNRSVHLISEYFGFYHAGIFLIDQSDEYAILRAASSSGGQRMLQRGHRLAVGSQGIVGSVAGSGEPRIASDTGEEAIFIENPDLPKTRSEMALPLQIRGEIIGVLDVQSVEPAAFSEEDVTTLQTMADQLAVALDNARLLERTEEQVRELQHLYGEFSDEMWKDVVTPRQHVGFMYDRVDVSPVDDGADLPVLNEALERNDLVVGDSTNEQGAALAIPLTLRGQVIGAIGVESQDGRRWSKDEIALAEAVGEQVALALEHARLFSESQRTALSMQTLYETSRALSSSLDEDSLIRAVLEAVDRTLGCEYTLMSLVDERTSSIATEHGFWQGEFDLFPEWIEMSSYALEEEDILTDVYHSGAIEIIDSWDPRFNRELWERYEHERYLRVFAPIKARDRVIGVIEVAYDKRRKSSFGDEDLQTLNALLDQAAVALENVRLFREAERRARREHQTYEIADRLRRSRDINRILQTAVDELGKALHTDRAVVRLRVKPREETGDGSDSPAETESKV